MQGNLEAVAEYLATAEVPGTTAEESAFRPGWGDIFRMNQQVPWWLTNCVARLLSYYDLDSVILFDAQLMNQQARAAAWGLCCSFAFAVACITPLRLMPA